MKKLLILLLIIGLGIGTYFGIKNIFFDKVEDSNVEMPSEIVYKLVSIEKKSELPGEIKVNGSNEWLVVKVLGKNHDSEARLFNMYYFTFIDENEDIYEVSPNSLNDAIIYGSLQPEETIAGTIVFKVPVGSKGKLVITDEQYDKLQELNIK